MDELEDKIGAIMNNPQMMQQIMAMASSLSGPPEESEPSHPEPESQGFDPALLTKIMGMAGQLGVDPQQKALLQALKPYLSHIRVQKLEKAMRAAKMAGMASVIFGKAGPQFLTGR
jgi:hypothetical protein